MAQNAPGKDQASPRGTTLSSVLRILDGENRLLERADQKAIALLSALGVFMVFFIVWHRIIPINPFTVVLLVIYFVVSLMAIVNLILTVRPRIQMTKEETEATGRACEPAFFAGICQFPSLSAYSEALQDMVKDEASTVEVYTRQIYNLARLNQTKYKHVQRAVLLVVIALGVELTLVAYLFPYYYFQGASVIPPLGG
jgi:cobalamin biosynthesis protein CobD/CbiB